MSDASNKNEVADIEERLDDARWNRVIARWIVLAPETNISPWEYIIVLKDDDPQRSFTSCSRFLAAKKALDYVKTLEVEAKCPPKPEEMCPKDRSTEMSNLGWELHIDEFYFPWLYFGHPDKGDTIHIDSDETPTQFAIRALKYARNKKTNKRTYIAGPTRHHNDFEYT